MYDHLRIINISDDEVYRPDRDTEIDVTNYAYRLEAMADNGPRGTPQTHMFATEITINGGGSFNTSGEAAISRSQGIGIEKKDDVKDGLVELQIK